MLVKGDDYSLNTFKKGNQRRLAHGPWGLRVDPIANL